MSMEEVELELLRLKPNWEGYSAPLEMKALKQTDAAVLTPIFKKHGKQIRTYLGQFHNADSWQMDSAQRFVMDALNRDFPSRTWTFWIGNKVVGLASLESYGGSTHDVQIVLAVFGEHQGKGIGTAIGKSLKYYSERVMGFSSFWWLVDESNIGSIKAAENLGLELHHTWTDEIKHSEMETGEWRAYWCPRPEGLEDGVLQGASLAYWHESKTSSFLQEVIKARKDLEDLTQQFYREAEGIREVREELGTEKNAIERALEQQANARKAAVQAFLNDLNRSMHRHESRKKKRKR